MRTRVALDELRSAIMRRLTVSFDYEGAAYHVEPHILGQSQRYRAFVLVARCLESEARWKAFRYAMMSNWNVHHNDRFDTAIEIPGSAVRCLAMIDTAARQHEL
mgnify:CR=1 FL=1